MTAAMVDGVPVSVDEVDAREARLRASRIASSLPRPGTSEGRQLRRWLTQVLVTERVVAAEAAARALSADGAPSEDDVLPDMAVRLEIGSVAASVLSEPLARALFASITAGVDVTDDEVAVVPGPESVALRRLCGHRRTPARSGAAPGVPAVAGRQVRHRRRTRPGIRAPRRSPPARQHA